MTDDLRFERLARDWLERGPVEAPPDVIEAALMEIDTTHQERYPRIPWRRMTVGGAGVATAAAVLLLVAGGGLNRLLEPAEGPLDGLLRPAGAAIAIAPTLDRRRRGGADDPGRRRGRCRLLARRDV